MPGMFYGTIVRDWRRGGKYSSYQAECISRMPSSELVGVLIKQQHNVQSDRKRYGRMVLPFIQHEYIILWQRTKQVMSTLQTLKTIADEQQRRVRSTWRSVVRTVLARLGGQADLGSLYEAIEREAPEKIKQNSSWREKLRQVVQIYDEFENVGRGVWRLKQAA